MSVKKCHLEFLSPTVIQGILKCESYEKNEDTVISSNNLILSPMKESSQKHQTIDTNHLIFIQKLKYIIKISIQSIPCLFSILSYKECIQNDPF